MADVLSIIGNDHFYVYEKVQTVPDISVGEK